MACAGFTGYTVDAGYAGRWNIMQEVQEQQKCAGSAGDAGMTAQNTYNR
jgi:hypothetical protein